MNDQVIMAKVKYLLLELGPSPSQVAETLARYRVNGKKGSATCCPVANFLKLHLADGEFGVLVRSDVTVTRRSPDVDGNRFRESPIIYGRKVGTAALPYAANKFIMMFDRGDFPSLDSEFTGFGAKFDRDIAVVNKIHTLAPMVMPPPIRIDPKALWGDAPGHAEEAARVGAGITGVIHVDVLKKDGTVEHTVMPNKVSTYAQVAGRIERTSAEPECDEPALVPRAVGANE
jgi:hypothetical protein